MSGVWRARTYSFLVLLWAGSAGAGPITRVACVGDSITKGLGTSPGKTYPLVLGGLLGPQFKVFAYGNPGATARRGSPDSYWDSPEFAESTASAPDLVVLFLGTNDALGVWNSPDSRSVFEQDYRALVATYAGLPSHPRIWLVQPPPIPKPERRVANRRLEVEILPVIARVAAETGSGLIDVRGAFGSDPSRYFGAGNGADLGDGVHPNDSGAAVIASKVAEALQTKSEGGLSLPGGCTTASRWPTFLPLGVAVLAMTFLRSLYDR